MHMPSERWVRRRGLTPFLGCSRFRPTSLDPVTLAEQNLLSDSLLLGTLPGLGAPRDRVPSNPQNPESDG